jgi:hypothetical protein
VGSLGETTGLQGSHRGSHTPGGRQAPWTPSLLPPQPGDINDLDTNGRCGHDQDEQLSVHRCDEFPIGTPAVHALVVGTSNYRQRGRKRVRRNRLFADLPGAAYAAARFALWLANQFHDFDGAQLVTERVLLCPLDESELSDISELGVSYGDAASRDAVREAVDDWYLDCNKPRSVGIMYLAGHGVWIGERDSVAVFLNGANFTSDPFDESINTHLTRTAMMCSSAMRSIYVYDCCAADLRERPRDRGIAPGLPEGPAREGNIKPLTIAAAAVGGAAYTSIDGGTLLSKTLLPLLDTAGELIGSVFVVTGRSLGPRLLAAISGVDQRQSPRVKGDHEIHVPSPPPEFEVRVISSADSSVSYRIVGPGNEQRDGTIQPGEIQTMVLPAGLYHVESENNSRRGRDRFELEVSAHGAECKVGGIPE